MRTYRLGGVAAAAVLALGLAACGSSGGGGAAAQTSQDTTSSGSSASGSVSGATVNVSETEFKIDPANPKIAKTGTVTFKVANEGKFPHALEVEGNGLEEQRTDGIRPGAGATVTVDLSKDGTYEWYCPVGNHRQMGMEGKITVGAGGGSSEDNGGSTTESSNNKSTY
jgi:plastocyanin